MSPESKLIFLTGVGRSGTTLLQSMMHAHPDMCFGTETHFFKKVIIHTQLRGGKIKGLDLLKLIRDNKIQERTALDLSGIRSEEILDLESLRRMFIGILEAACPGSPVIGDKDTEYVRYVPHLKFHFPDAYLIQIVRDPRDVLTSRKKAGWSKNTLTAFHAAEYQFYMERLPDWGKKSFGERYISLRYEDLISDPEQELRKLCDKLGIDFQGSMLHYHEQNADLVAGDEREWKENVFKPVISGNSGKWKDSLSSRELGMVEIGYEDQMQEWGYEVDGNGRLNYLDRLLREAYRFALMRKTQRESI